MSLRLPWFFWIAGSTLLAFSCGDSNSKHGVAVGCTLNSDCDTGLVCTFARCHQQCQKSVDCADGGRCVIGEQGLHVCVLPQDDSECLYSSMCPMPLKCAVDQKCRNQCVTAADCITGQVCAKTGVCADPAEVNAAGELLSTAAGEGGAAGASANAGGASGSGAVSASGGHASAGRGALAGAGGVSAGAGGSNEEGGAGGIATCSLLLPDGSCSYCPPAACAHGSCVSGDHDYSCACNPGFSGTGSKTCLLTDACSANLMCPVAYPCIPTPLPGGGVCLGEFAVFPMPDTQTKGSVTPSYSGSTDVVIDNVTTLEWQRASTNDCTIASAGGAGSGGAGGNVSTLSTPCTYTAAKTYCASLDLDGKNDWRVPTKIELVSLLDCVHSFVPLIDTDAFPVTVADWYWTSSPAVDGSAANWIVNFASMTTELEPYAGAENVRCVRGNGLRATTAIEHYTLVPASQLGSGGAAGDASTENAGTIVDNWTGLTWEAGSGSSTLVNYQDAGLHCASLGAGFRLPTYKELSTLLDPSRRNPAIDIDVFPGTPAEAFWTSTPQGEGGYMIVSFGDESATGDGAVTDARGARCVHP